jgi:hypothetical protein
MKGASDTGHNVTVNGLDRLGKTGEWTNHMLFGNPANSVESKGFVPTTSRPSGWLLKSIVNDQTANNRAADDLQNLWASLGNQPESAPMADDGGAAAAAAAYQAQVAAAQKQIEEQFNVLRGQLDTRKTAADQRIGDVNKDYSTAISGRYADQTKNQNVLQQDILGRMASTMADSQGTANEIGGYARALGLDPSHLMAQSMANQNTLQQNGNVAADLGTRIAQIAANSNTDWQRSGDLMKQGALDNAQNNYMTAANSLDSQKQAALMNAASGGSGDGGGGGSRSSSTKTTADERASAMLQDTIDSAILSNDPNQQLAAMYKANPDMANFLVAQTDFSNGDQKSSFYNTIASTLYGLASPSALQYQNNTARASDILARVRSGASSTGGARTTGFGVRK